MKVCIAGLWHLGSVTAACLASLHHDVLGVDDDATVVANLNKGIAPIFEPGLQELLEEGLKSGRLSFATLSSAAVDADIVWMAYDTPVDADDKADAELVVAQTKRLFESVRDNAFVLVSAQLPVGTIRRLEEFAAARFAQKRLRFASVPENLRLGKALETFLRPDRLVVGVRESTDRSALLPFLNSITPNLEWMSIESAEMTKHAINAFLAMSVAFANEIASLCETVGADAKQVERGLKSESRIGYKAYLSPGAAFAGGTLARDVEFLSAIASAKGVTAALLKSVPASNNEHKHWTKKKLLDSFGDLAGVRIAVWGLTYKVDTDTLRRSMAVELCDWLIERGAVVGVHDPAVKSLPARWRGKIVHHEDPIAAAEGAQALVVGTEWPLYRDCAISALLRLAEQAMVIDPNRLLPEAARKRDGLNYFAVGAPPNSASTL